MKKNKLDQQKASRNAICPICHKKQKNCQGHSIMRTPRIITPVLVLLFFCLLFIVFTWMKDWRADKEQTNVRLARNNISLYLDSHAEVTHGWLDRYAPENHAVLYELLNAKKKVILALLQRYSGASPLAKKIVASFPTFLTTIYYQGSSVVIRKSQQDSEQSSSALEICFVPIDQAGDLPSLFYYQKEWPALMLTAVDCPEKIFASLLFHELGHAYFHLVAHSPSANAPIDSDLFIGEEVKTHDLESEILNSATGGKFFEWIDQLIARSKKNDSHEIVLSLTAEELRQADLITDGIFCDQNIARVLAAQYIVAIGFKCIEKKGGQNTFEQKIKFYRWLTKNFTQPR
jgi:hypothetical protein